MEHRESQEMLDTYEIRLGTASDLEAVVRLAQPREVDFEACQLFTSRSAGQMTGYLLLKKTFEHALTGDLESAISDLRASSPEEQRKLLDYAIAAAIADSAQFISLKIPPDPVQSKQLQELGFQLESQKISVATANCSAPEGSPYEVRLANEGDHFGIAVLNSTLVSHTLCPGRDYDLTQVTFRAMEAMFRQLNDPKSVALVLTKDQEMAGYLILTMSEKSAYIYDLAISPEHWGGKAVLHIMRAGSQLLFQRNIPLLVGDVSASNLRASKIAQRYLGFRVDSQTYALRLSSDKGLASIDPKLPS